MHVPHEPLHTLVAFSGKVIDPTAPTVLYGMRTVLLDAGILQPDEMAKAVAALPSGAVRETENRVREPEPRGESGFSGTLDARVPLTHAISTPVLLWPATDQPDVGLSAVVLPFPPAAER